MGKDTHIEWCDHSFNPWEGCTKVSPGCAHCYAEARNARFGGGTAPNWGVGAPRRRTSAHNWNEPLRWNREAEARLQDWRQSGEIRGFLAPRSPRVFCASLADVFDEEVPHAWREQLWMLIRMCPNLTWLLLTKRPGNVYNMVPMAWLCGDWPRNVWLGTTVEDQERAAERIPQLVHLPAPVHFISCEPLLGPLDVDPHLESVDWVICGGESGRNARSMNPDWARSLRDQCQRRGIAFFFKQWGEHNAAGVKVGKFAAGRILDDADWCQFPEERK